MSIEKSSIFEGEPKAEALFETVRAFVESLGDDIEVVHHKTQVTFRAKTGFAYVWRPQIWKIRRPEGSIILSFDLGRQIADPRIEESAPARKGRWVHHVSLQKKSDFTKDVKDWLREAYAFGQIDRRKRRQDRDASKS